MENVSGIDMFVKTASSGNIAKAAAALGADGLIHSRPLSRDSNGALPIALAIIPWCLRVEICRWHETAVGQFRPVRSEDEMSR